MGLEPLDGKDAYNLIQVASVESENVRIIATADRSRSWAPRMSTRVPANCSKGFLPKQLVYIEDVGDGKAKSDKFERDERLLRRELEKDPNNVRTVFDLANTLKDQGKYHEAIPFYERRVAMGGWFAEADYSVHAEHVLPGAWVMRTMLASTQNGGLHADSSSRRATLLSGPLSASAVPVPARIKNTNHPETGGGTSLIYR